MTLAKIRRILDLHNVEHTTEKSRIYAEEVYTDRDGALSSVWVDVTDYNTKKLLDFLGY